MSPTKLILFTLKSYFMTKQNNQKRLKDWRAILRAPPNMEVVTLMVASLPNDLALCQALPRHGWWFNKVRQLMNVDPKTLRKILVKGREANIAKTLSSTKPKKSYD